MADLYDYLTWRGDLCFSDVPLNPVDALIFSTFSYIQFEGIVPDTYKKEIALREAAALFLEKPGCENMVRVKQDLALLRSAMDTSRFGNTKLTFYRSVLDMEKEKQFAAMTFLLDDGNAVLVFRGTDQTIAGWKEDFNMTFCERVPAQDEALRYVSEFAKGNSVKFYLAGHSKGGNLAVYSAIKCEEEIRSRIIRIYNQDGPGFNDYLMGDPVYHALVPKISTYLPQSSIVGMLLEHEEPYYVIKSRQIGVMQHNPYSWELEGPDFVYLEAVSEGSRRFNKALKNWLAGMTLEERSTFADTVYGILTSGGASQTSDLIHPQNVRTVVRTLSENEEMRQLIANELGALMQSLRNT